MEENAPSALDLQKLWLDQLTQEYKILQEKIDKIGGFRFTVRGWSVTLVVGAIIGIATAKLSSYYILFGLIVVVFGFLAMERAQTRHGRTFSRRAAKLEKRIWFLLRASTPSDATYARGGMVPRIAHEIDEERTSRPRLGVWLDHWGYCFFYGFQVALIVFVVLLEHNKESLAPEKATTILNLFDNSVSSNTEENAKGKSNSPRQQNGKSQDKAGKSR